MVLSMVRVAFVFRAILASCGIVLPLAVPVVHAAQPSPAAVATFNAYAAAVDNRLAEQHRSSQSFFGSFLVDPQAEQRMRQGDLIVEQLSPAAGVELPGALLHHWRGTAFVPGVTAADFDRLMRDFAGYPRDYAPQVLAAQVQTHEGDRYQVGMRLRQKHVLTVTMDATYDVSFGRLDAQHGFSYSRSTRIDELDSSGRALPAEAQHGFLWRLDTWWSYAEQDGGLLIQIESLSLTRSIPAGLAWAVRPFIESVPRESLEFTLRSTCAALRNLPEQAAK